MPMMRRLKIGDRVTVIQLVPSSVYPIGVIVDVKPPATGNEEEYVVEFEPGWRESFLEMQLKRED